MAKIKRRDGSGVIVDLIDTDDIERRISALEALCGPVEKVHTSIAAGFAAYSGGQIPTLSRFGRVVCLAGAVKPTAAFATNVETLIATVPDGWRPVEHVRTLCQGSGANKFMLQIVPDGSVFVSRYGGTSYVNCPAGSWLTLDATWIC